MHVTQPRVGGGRLRLATPSLPLGALFGVILASFVAGALHIGDAAPLWVRLMRLALAAAGFWVASSAVRRGNARERVIRGAITVALGIWAVTELVRLGYAAQGHPPQVGIEASVVVLAAIGAFVFVAAAHGLIRRSDEIALYLDALLIFAATVALVLILGGDLLGDPTGLTLLVMGGFCLAMLGAMLILVLTLRMPVRLGGAYAVVAGLLVTGIGFTGLLVIDHELIGVGLHALIGAGPVLAGFGAAGWRSEEPLIEGGDRRPGDRLRFWLPIWAVCLAPLYIIVLVIGRVPSEPGAAAAAAAAVVVMIMAGILRQTVLLADREASVRVERELRSELSVAEAQYRSVVDRVPGVVYVAEVGMAGRWHFVSSRIEELLGFPVAEWLENPSFWDERMHPADRARMALAERATTEPSYTGSRWEYRLIARDDHEVWIMDDEAVIARDAAGRPTLVQGILLDISDRKQLEEQLRHQALHDPLTGLPNRALFGDRVERALSRRAGNVSVLFLDIDDFKTVNDSLGHAVGDELLVHVARRLGGVLRESETPCRLGGDEFAILLEGVSPQVAVTVAQRIIAALHAPFAVGERNVLLRASIGAASGDTGIEAEELLRHADTAMYAAKALGKGRVEVFRAGMEQPIQRRLVLRTSLEAALDGDELFLEYQPIIDMHTGDTVGVEALSRWKHPQLGPVMPLDFIPLAEELGLIGRLGQWALERACSDLAHAPVAASIGVSVNVSAHQLGGPEFAEHVRAALAVSGLAPERLTLELTESTLASAGDGAEIELRGLHALGVKIALDDFGSGFSSLEYLGRLPLDVLKIDRSLVMSAHHDDQRRRVLRAIGQLATDLGIATVVEGVERDDQRRALMELGFGRAQGFFFSPPVPLAQALSRDEADAA